MSDTFSRLRTLARAHGYDLVRRRNAGRPTKWTHERLCDLWVKVEYEKWARKLKTRPAIAAKGSWPPLDIYGWPDTGPIEVCIANGTFTSRQGVVNTVRRKYAEAVSLLNRDPHLRQRCLDDLECAKRWHPYVSTMKRRRRA